MLGLPPFRPPSLSSTMSPITNPANTTTAGPSTGSTAQQHAEETRRSPPEVIDLCNSDDDDDMEDHGATTATVGSHDKDGDVKMEGEGKCCWGRGYWPWTELTRVVGLPWFLVCGDRGRSRGQHHGGLGRRGASFESHA